MLVLATIRRNVHDFQEIPQSPALEIALAHSHPS